MSGSLDSATMAEVRRLAAAADRFSLEAMRLSCLVRIPTFVDTPLQSEVWRPPPEGRFCALGPEDEVWARPLGIGEVVQVDWLRVRNRLMADFERRLEQKILAPRFLICGGV